MPLPETLGNADRLKDTAWAAALLADENFVFAPTNSRTPKASGEDSFIAETLSTERTIRNWVTQHSLPRDNIWPAITEVRSFLDLGDGLNGYPATMHGGMIATLLDELTGLLLNVNNDHQNRISSTGKPLSAMTAYLNVSYKKPLPLPGVILGTAKFTSVDGRKFYMRGTLEDGTGQVYAIGEALYIEIRPKV
ncbi:Thioesterase superfamily member 4 [Diplodia seriata]|uniref:Thioesterase superfamily member 4 n=1 Tax=Diplodia seriata TaxID=420778 RepID=A0A1S8BGQ9_9PEZI|nr:Thioesterase superfamily member 4 [Diplodia seriata]OMP86702.1 Thioesterase superfamily member 4 [Diplodia seriata]